MTKTYFYQFADGYFCYSTGKMTKAEILWEKRQHGTLVVMKVV